jgi:xyloglucan-specific exo-beta-1,4-glucanase
MRKNQIAGLAGVVAILLSGCGASSGVSGGGGEAPSAGGPLFGAGSNEAKAIVPAKWASVKFGGGGYVPGLVFHPTSPDVLYARTDMGGAYRWDAVSATWVPITDGFSAAETFYHGSESMALDPNDDRRVYMSTGMYLSDKADARLYISTDRGDNWTYVNLPFSAASNAQGRAVGERLMVDPNNPAILFYATRTTGLWKSADRGQTWQQLSSLSSHKMTNAQIDTAQWRGVVGMEQVVFDTSTKGTGVATQTIYTAVAPDYAAFAGLTFSMYKTTDGGATWSGIATPVTGYHIPHMVRAKDGMMYVAFTQGTGPGASGSARLYKFDGSNWTLLKSYDSQSAGTGFGMGGLSVSGTGASTRIALGVTNSWGNWDGQPIVQLSDDAGVTWREISGLAPHGGQADGWSGWVDDVEIDPNNPERVLHVHGGGVWETRNASAAKPTWVHTAASGIEETATLALMTPPPGASYSVLNSSGDIGMYVHTDLNTTPTRGPKGFFGNGVSADMAWSNPAYIAAIGTSTWDHANVGGAYSTDSGVTWTAFAANHPDGLAHQGNDSSLAVTKPGSIVWAPNDSVPAYTTNHGASWTYTNLPAVASGRSYRLAADRKNSNRVYAYESGGGWWGPAPKFYASTDGGQTFTVSSQFSASGPRPEFVSNTSLAVNPNAEGDVWVADGHSIFHTLNGGATWTKLNVTASIWGSHPVTEWPEVYGATSIALGKAPAGASYSASVYVVGVINGVWGVHRSDNGGSTWRRFNDDKHQYGGIGSLAADQTVAGRLFMGGSGRGVLYSY